MHLPVLSTSSHKGAHRHNVTSMANNLKKEYRKRADETTETMSSLRDGFDRRTGDFFDAAENLRQEAGKRVDHIHEQVDHSIDDSRKAVQDHALLAVGVALGVGILAGLLLRGKSKAKPS